MSNFIMPMPVSGQGNYSLPVKKTPVFDTTVFKATSGVETTTSLTPWTTWNYQYDFSYLLGDEATANSAYQAFLGFFGAVKGGYDNWLFQDPMLIASDYTCKNQPLSFTDGSPNLGDGVTTSFQLTRNTAGLVEKIQAFDGVPTVAVAGIVVPSSSKNLVTDSNGTGLTWTVNSFLPFSPTGGAIAGGKWTYTGTGAASSFQIVASKIFNVTPGATYTLSGNIDGSHVTGSTGSPSWLVYNPSITTNYGSAFQANGINSRVSGTFTVPPGVTQVVCLPDTGNCTVVSGQPLVFSDPQLELGSVATSYENSKTGWSLGENGLVTFNIPPASGAVISWSGSFFHVCRFDNDTLDGLQRDFQQFYSASGVKFHTVLLP